jgi:hypothetical protein
MAGQVCSLASTRIDKKLNHDKNFMLNLHPKADQGGHVVVQMTHGQTHQSLTMKLISKLLSSYLIELKLNGA